VEEIGLGCLKVEECVDDVPLGVVEKIHLACEGFNGKWQDVASRAAVIEMEADL